MTSPACAIGASSASYSVLKQCCGASAHIATTQNNCVLYCEPKGLSLNTVSQCIFLNMGQSMPGYSGGIHCNRQGDEFSSSVVAPGPTSTQTGTGTGKSSDARRLAVGHGVGGSGSWGALVVGWAVACVVAGGVAIR
jgi:hypothetical protein